MCFSRRGKHGPGSKRGSLCWEKEKIVGISTGDGMVAVGGVGGVGGGDGGG